MQNIDYQSFVNYVKMRYMAIADGFDVSFDGLSSKRLHDDVLHISKKPLRGELSGFLSIYQAEASCISPKVY